jgi:hypothetical protein
MGITWTDVRSTIPQALIAENAVAGPLRVKARLKLDRASNKPYQCIYTLWDRKNLIDTWERSYGGNRGFASATKSYYDRKQAAERWLLGEPLEEIKGKGW